MTSNDEQKKPLIPKWFGFAVAAIFIAWALWPWILKSFMLPPDRQPGEFGDSYGAINTLFSGLAFLGVLLSIFIQGQEFRNQLKEMATTTSEMKNQTELSQKQLRALSIQTELLELQHKQSMLQSELDALPFFEFWLLADELNNLNEGKIPLNADFTNHGSQVFGVQIEFLNYKLPIESLPTLKRLKLTVPADIMILSEKKPIPLKISYYTRTGKNRAEDFLIDITIKDPSTDKILMGGNPGRTDQGARIAKIKMELGINDRSDSGNIAQTPVNV